MKLEKKINENKVLKKKALAKPSEVVKTASRTKQTIIIL